jgi:hypothetical protein
MLELAQDRPAFNIVKHMVIFVGLVWKLSVIQENILQMLAVLGFRFNPDGRSLSRRGGSHGSSAKSWFCFETRLPGMRERVGIKCVSVGIIVKNVRPCRSAGTINRCNPKRCYILITPEVITTNGVSKGTMAGRFLMMLRWPTGCNSQITVLP